jgi:ATP-binding cassette subfamily F protein 3
VSHDRALLDAVGTRTVAVEEGTLRSYDGGWADYARERDARRHAAEEAETEHRRVRKAGKPASNGKAGAKGSATGKGLSKNARRRVAALEREIERAEAALREIEDELAGTEAWSTPERSAKATARHTAAKRAVEEAYAEWEHASSGAAVP